MLALEAASWSTCTRRVSRSPRCCRPAASTRSSPICRSSRAPRSVASSAARRRARASAGRPRGRDVHARGLRGDRRRARIAHFPPRGWARRRAGRGTGPELPHRLLRASSCAGVAAGETVLVHGAAGGVGTATLQVAKGLGARTFAVVSDDEKEAVARQAGADEVFRSDGPWKERRCCAAGGADVVIDPVGGDRMTDSLRCLHEGGRFVVVGFTGGQHPRGQGQPSAAQQRLGRRRGLGRLRDLQAGLRAEIQREIDKPDRRARPADRRRPPAARARGGGTGADRRAARDRQGRAGTSARLARAARPRDSAGPDGEHCPGEVCLRPRSRSPQPLNGFRIVARRVESPQKTAKAREPLERLRAVSDA